jgi:dihydroxyacetone kinase-like predicted kinase
MQAVVIDGASGSLPPVADLLAAIVDVSAHQVVVLPGHRNVLSAAQQAADVAQREHGSTVRVLESAVTPPSVLAALAVLDPDGDPGATMDDMAAAAAAVRAGEVVAAIRDADTPVGSVRAGQFLGVADRDVVAVDDDPVAVLRAVLHHLDAAAAEILTLLIGADVKDDEAEAVTTLLADAAPNADVEIIAAGQRPSRYWVGVE